MNLAIIIHVLFVCLFLLIFNGGYTELTNFTPSECGTRPLMSFLFCPTHLSFSLPFVLLQVLDNDIMLKLERKFLHEVPAELSGLLEPVSDPEARLRLLSKDTLLVRGGIEANISK